MELDQHGIINVIPLTGLYTRNFNTGSGCEKAKMEEYCVNGTTEIVRGKSLKLSGEDVLPGPVVEIEL